MDIEITEWALDSYLSLVSSHTFSRSEYKDTIRPDVRRLKSFPSDPKFGNDKFWSPAQDPSQGGVIPGGYKMKWHNIGNGQVQLRLPLGMSHHAVLCQAYAKKNANYERRMLAKFKTHLQLIRQGQYTVRGRLP